MRVHDWQTANPPDLLNMPSRWNQQVSTGPLFALIHEQRSKRRSRRDLDRCTGVFVKHRRHCTEGVQQQQALYVSVIQGWWKAQSKHVCCYGTIPWCFVRQSQDLLAPSLTCLTMP